MSADQALSEAGAAPGDDDDRSAIEQILAQQAAVAEIGQRALSERRLEILFAEAAALVSRILATELVSIMQLAPDGESLQLIAGAGWRDGVVGELSLGTETGSMAGYTLVTGGAVIVEDFAAETRFTVSDALRAHGAVSGMSVRIGESEQPFGALLVFTGRRGHFTTDDANFLQAVANVLAGAIAGMRAESELRRSRDELAAIVSSVTDGITVQGRDGRLAFANDAAARLTGYPTAEELAAASIGEILARFELLDEDGRPLPLERLPGRRAMAGEVVPGTLVRFRIVASGEEHWSIVQASPVHADDGSVAQVVNVFRDITSEKRAADSHRFLTEALARMSSTLDPAEAARRLADACVPAMADYCVVDLLEPDGSIQTAALVHFDPRRTELALRERELRPIHLTDPTGPARVMREGTSEMVQITEDMLRSSASSRGELDLLLALDLHCYICVPLMARGRPIGALTLVTAESGRSFRAEDLQMAEELAARAGAAIENARLYEAVDDRRAELDAVLMAMAEAVLVFDARGRLRLSNLAAERLFGGEVPQTTADLADRLAPVESQNGDRSTDLADAAEVQLPGSGRWLEMRRYRSVRTAADRSERDAPSVVVLRDVTDARAANAARDAFLGLLSHELRTPITTIYGGSQLLERDLDEDRRAEVLRDIKAESERLARLVEDLLVMTRVERGGLEIGDEPVLVQRVLPSLTDALASRWPGLAVEINLAEALPAVRGDVTYIEQVLRNLLTNAVRYGDALESGLTVDVEEDDGEVLVRVLDRGPGLAAEEPERLFELFYRSPSARAVPGGAGIGLFVCRNLVEAMGGRIWARPRPGGGAEFGFALPVLDADLG